MRAFISQTIFLYLLAYLLGKLHPPTPRFAIPSFKKHIYPQTAGHLQSHSSGNKTPVTPPFTMLKHYLQRQLGVELELLDSLGPGLELVCFRINVVVEDGACSGELDGLEVRDPPLGEFHSVVHQLQEIKTTRLKISLASGQNAVFVLQEAPALANPPGSTLQSTAVLILLYQRISVSVCLVLSV